MEAANQVAVPLFCTQCKQAGSIKYRAGADIAERKSGAAIVSISTGFYRRMIRNHCGLAELVCDICGRVQQGFDRIECTGRSTTANVRF
jgi:hypothetical protein